MTGPSVLRRAAAVGAVVFAIGAPARAQAVPTLTAPVNDFAHVIDADSARVLDARIRALQETTGDVLVVATVPTFAPYGSIEEYAVKMFEQTGIGQKGQNNGALILVAVNDHRVRIEVGYGLEEYITDGFSGDTIRQAMLPAFRSGNFGQGIVAAATRVVQRLGEARGKEIPGVPKSAVSVRVGQTGGFPAGVIIVIIIASLFFGGSGLVGVIASLFFGSAFGGRRGPWGGGLGGFGGGFGGGGFGGGGGGFGGGGFGGFGGGGSGGGGASGSW